MLSRKGRRVVEGETPPPPLLLFCAKGLVEIKGPLPPHPPLFTYVFKDFSLSDGPPQRDPRLNTLDLIRGPGSSR